MKKSEMLNKNQLMHVRTEKEILTANNPWIVNLKYSFQDEQFLYLVMNFLPGGDLMNLLMKKDILTEEEARFYTAEMILAVDSVHKLNCIHRDLKPDNILIGKDGHIQLSDFGLSKISDKTFFPLSTKDDDNNNNKLVNNPKDLITMHNPKSGTTSGSSLGSKTGKKRTRLMAYSTVGTPDYIAPEVFGKEGYGQEVDWWSIGVMFFEMVCGYPPFFCDNPGDTCKKITKWRQYFTIPNDPPLSNEAKNLILRFVTYPQNRLGVNGVEEIKRHPFFKGVDWDNIRNSKPPFIPELKNDWDTHYFDSFEEEEPFYPPVSKKMRKRKDVNYPGYTFNRDLENNNINGFQNALEEIEVIKQNLQSKKKEEETPKDNSSNNEEEDFEGLNGEDELPNQPKEKKIEPQTLKGYLSNNQGHVEKIKPQMGNQVRDSERNGHINLPRSLQPNLALKTAEKRKEDCSVIEKSFSGNSLAPHIVNSINHQMKEQLTHSHNENSNSKECMSESLSKSEITYISNNKSTNSNNQSGQQSKTILSNTLNVNIKKATGTTPGKINNTLKNVPPHKDNANYNFIKMINNNNNTVGLGNDLLPKKVNFQAKLKNTEPSMLKKLKNIDTNDNSYRNNVVNTSPNNHNFGGLRSKYESNNILNPPIQQHMNEISSNIPSANRQGEVVTGQLVNKIVIANDLNKGILLNKKLSKSPPNKNKINLKSNIIAQPKTQRTNVNPGTKLPSTSSKEKISLMGKLNYKNESNSSSTNKKPQIAIGHYGSNNNSYKTSVIKPPITTTTTITGTKK